MSVYKGRKWGIGAYQVRGDNQGSSINVYGTSGYREGGEGSTDGGSIGFFVTGMSMKRYNLVGLNTDGKLVQANFESFNDIPIKPAVPAIGIIKSDCYAGETIEVFNNILLNLAPMCSIEENEGIPFQSILKDRNYFLNKPDELSGMEVLTGGFKENWTFAKYSNGNYRIFQQIGRGLDENQIFISCGKWDKMV